MELGDDRIFATHLFQRIVELPQYAQAMRRWPRGAMRALRRQHVDSGAFDLCTFPPIPTTLSRFRTALYSVALQTRDQLYEAFARPTRYWQFGESCIVEVLGSFCVHFDFNQRAVRVEKRSGCDWKPVPDTGIDLLQPLPTDEWCMCFSQQLRQRLWIGLGPEYRSAAEETAALEWVVAVVRRLADRSRLLDHVRVRICEAYPCNKQVLADLRACKIDPFAQRSLTGRDYAWGWQRADILRGRVQESRRLVPVWYLAVDDALLTCDQGYDALRVVLRGFGVSTSGWKLLCEYGSRLFSPLRGQDTTGELDVLASYFRLLQRAQATAPMPVALVRALYAGHWFAGKLVRDTLPLGMIRGAIARVVAMTSTADVEQFLEQEFVPVLGWIARAKPEFDANQQRASWDWFLTNYRRWSECERRRREGTRWTHGIDVLRWRHFAIVPIRDSVTLWAEGEQMHTCLSTYEWACVEGRYLIYSVRAGARHRPVAHIGIAFDKDGFVRLQQVRGFANTRVEPAMEAFASRLAEMNQRAARPEIE